jgi:hypothetical protein
VRYKYLLPTVNFVEEKERATFIIFEWKGKSYTKDNYAIKVAKTSGCNYSISRKLRTSTSSKSWGFGSRNNLRH